MVKCPACSSELIEESVGSIKVDLCHSGCGGIWFDRGELAQLDEESEPLPTMRQPSPGTDQRNPFPRHCPRCENSHMVVQQYDSESPVEIDMCWECGGVWLDRGELERIRQSGTDRESAGNAIVRESLSLKDLAKLHGGAGRRQGIPETAKAELPPIIGRLRGWLSKAA